jgi:hypothetical protein
MHGLFTIISIGAIAIGLFDINPPPILFGTLL